MQTFAFRFGILGNMSNIWPVETKALFSKSVDPVSA